MNERERLERAQLSESFQEANVALEKAMIEYEKQAHNYDPAVRGVFSALSESAKASIDMLKTLCNTRVT